MTTSDEPTRLDIFVRESIEMYTGLSATETPSQFPPVTLEGIGPALYFRTNHGKTGTVVVTYEKHVLQDPDLAIVHQRMVEVVRDLAADPEVWGYSAIVPFHWPGGLLHGEPGQEGLLIRAADRTMSRGLALFHRWVLEGRRIATLEPPLFMKQSASWFELSP